MKNLKYFEIDFNIPFPLKNPQVKKETQMNEYMKNLNTFYLQEFLKIKTNLDQYSIANEFTFDSNEEKENNCILVNRVMYKNVRNIQKSLECGLISRKCKLDSFRVLEGKIQRKRGLYIRVVQFGNYHNSNDSQSWEFILLHYITKNFQIQKQKQNLSRQQQAQKDVRYQAIKKNYFQNEEESQSQENQHSINDISKIMPSFQSKPLTSIKMVSENLSESDIQPPKDNKSDLQPPIQLKYEYDDESNLIKKPKEQNKDQKNQWIEDKADQSIEIEILIKQKEIEILKLQQILFNSKISYGSNVDKPITIN